MREVIKATLSVISMKAGAKPCQIKKMWRETRHLTYLHQFLLVIHNQHKSTMYHCQLPPETTTTTMPVLMPSFQLAGVSNFCSNLLSPFLSIVHILSSQALSFQILLYTLFSRFPWSTLLPFPSYFKFHNPTYLGIDVSTHDMTIPPQMVLNYHILNLHSNTHPITKNIS